MTIRFKNGAETSKPITLEIDVKSGTEQYMDATVSAWVGWQMSSVSAGRWSKLACVTANGRSATNRLMAISRPKTHDLSSTRIGPAPSPNRRL
jgi:hypothetical protein